MAEQKEMETMEQPEAGQAEETQEAPPCPEGDTGEGNQAQPEGAEESPETEEAGEVPEEGGEEPAGEGQGEQKKSFFKKKDKKNRSKVLHLLSAACNYNFIKLSMCIYNFNVAFRISINRILSEIPI